MPPEATPPTLPESLGLEHLTAALAFDLAARLSDLPTIMKRYGLTEDMLRVALTHPPFVKLICEAQSKWSSDMSTAERVRIKAQFALESCILPVHTIAHDAKAGTANRIDAVKLIAAIAGMSRGDAVAQEGAKFNLQINLGERSASLTAAAPPVIDQQS